MKSSQYIQKTYQYAQQQICIIHVTHTHTHIMGNKQYMNNDRTASRNNTQGQSSQNKQVNETQTVTYLGKHIINVVSKILLIFNIKSTIHYK